jgi:hypothetical protein
MTFLLSLTTLQGWKSPRCTRVFASPDSEEDGKEDEAEAAGVAERDAAKVAAMAPITLHIEHETPAYACFSYTDASPAPNFYKRRVCRSPPLPPPYDGNPHASVPSSSFRSADSSAAALLPDPTFGEPSIGDAPSNRHRTTSSPASPGDKPPALIPVPTSCKSFFPTYACYLASSPLPLLALFGLSCGRFRRFHHCPVLASLTLITCCRLMRHHGHHLLPLSILLLAHEPAGPAHSHAAQYDAGLHVLPPAGARRRGREAGRGRE